MNRLETQFVSFMKATFGDAQPPEDATAMLRAAFFGGALSAMHISTDGHQVELLAEIGARANGELEEIRARRRCRQ